MNLTPLAANMTEVKMTGGLTVLFSYKTAVACLWTNGNDAYKAFKTEKKWSATTTRHINKWLGLHPEVFGAAYKPQEYFDNLLAEVK